MYAGRDWIEILEMSVHVALYRERCRTLSGNRTVGRAADRSLGRGRFHRPTDGIGIGIYASQAGF